jgi:hypothetical protein
MLGRRPRWPAALPLLFCLIGGVASGCAARKAQAPEPGEAAAAGQDAGRTPPLVSIGVKYSGTEDYLKSIRVVKYTSATLLRTRRVSATERASVVRFHGGVPVWTVRAELGLLSRMPGLNYRKKLSPSSLVYGQLPEHFVQVVPEKGPPEPLKAGRYYVFAVKRASGAANLEAVKIDPDGGVEGYTADPRAGTSYELCCNVRPEFVSDGESPLRADR